MKEDINTPVSLAFDYTFKKLLGEGANGKTWLAQSKKNGSEVAIKQLKLGVDADIKVLELFNREAETLKSLNVPGVPKFYDTIFNSDDGTCFLIQEYVPYPSLIDQLNVGKKYDEKTTLRIIERLANIIKILQMNYTPPIIHRDIKPSNILCRLDKSTLDLALIDFGAVANPQKRSGGSTIAGTFGYMAPEQMQGEFCIQSDYYAIGATALHMLTAISPYNMPSDVFRLDYKTTLNQEAPNVSKQMIELLDYLLAEKPSDRPENAKMLLEAIHNVQKGKSPRYVAPPRKLVRRNPIIQFFVNIMKKLSREDSVKSTGGRLLTTVTNKWVTVTATAIDTIQKDNTVLLEYSFEVANTEFIGADVLPDGFQLKFPSPVVIIYNPENPRVNCIEKNCLDLSR